MARVLFLLTIATTCGIAQGQTDAGANAGGTETIGGNGGIATTDLGGQGVTTGPTERTSTFATDTENAFTQTPGAQTFQTRNFNGGGQNRQVITGGSTQTQRQVRPTFRLGFVPSAALQARTRQRAVSRFTTITPRVRELRGMSMSSGQNGSVILRGQATSRYGSLLAAAIARLEPGVRRVRNEIQVNPGATSTSVRPAPMISQPQAPGIQLPVQGVPSRTVPANPAPPILDMPIQTPSLQQPLPPQTAPRQTPLRGATSVPSPPVVPPIPPAR